MEEADHACCSICLETLDAPEVLECGHGFHASCLVRWFRQGNTSCPLCRDDVERLPPLPLVARACFLRTYARRLDAPVALKKLVDRLRRAETSEREQQATLRRCLHQHRDVRRLLAREEAKRRACHRRVDRLKHLLSLFDTPDVPLPPVVAPLLPPDEWDGPDGPTDLLSLQ